MVDVVKELGGLLEERAITLQSELDRCRQLDALMTQLLELTSELAQAHTREDIARLTLEKALRTLGAAAAALWTISADGTHLELIAASDAEGAVAVGCQQLPVDGDTPVAIAVRTDEPIFLGSRAEYATRYPASYARFQAVAQSSHVAFTMIPLTAGNTKIGALCFTYAQERTFEDAGRHYKMIVARHVALALARVQLVEEERAQRHAAEQAARAEKRARADIEVLYELIASLNRIDDIDAVYDYALRSIMRISCSQRAAILLVDHAGVMRFRAHVGLSETFRAALETYTPWQSDEQFPAPIAVDDIEVAPSLAAYREVFHAEGIRAVAFVPIVHKRTLIGRFMLYRGEPQPFAPRDLQLTATVAVHVAQGVERKQQESELARAYREEREAHLLADEATRAREEIISVVSHDLRNPLGTIMMDAATLLDVDLGDRRHRVRTAGDRIHRQAERMARLIEDLVDFAGIQAGQLPLARGVHAPESILSSTTDIFAPIASERGLRLETEILPGLPAVECDSDRAVQVLSNLVANALKVTPRGGLIAIGAQPNAKQIVFYVRDTGPGIEAEELPNLFERYWRGKQSSYKAIGLGLSIARGIVDAHGGRIWAESALGAGSTFFFSLTPNN